MHRASIKFVHNMQPTRVIVNLVIWTVRNPQPLHGPFSRSTLVRPCEKTYRNFNGLWLVAGTYPLTPCTV